ncbi:unnamed protein product [Lampetra planeri]
MDLEDDTTVLTTMKSFNSFISHPEHPQRLSEHSAGTVNLQMQYKRSMEFLDAAEKVELKNRFLQLDQEKKQMELSHKRARFELEKAASDNARDLELVSCLKDEIRDLKQKLQSQDSTVSNQNLKNQELQEQLDLQRRKYQEMSQLCQSLQAAQSSSSQHIIKIKYRFSRRLSSVQKPDDLSREVIQIQQREITLNEQNYTLNSR